MQKCTWMGKWSHCPSWVCIGEGKPFLQLVSVSLYPTAVCNGVEKSSPCHVPVCTRIRKLSLCPVQVCTRVGKATLNNAQVHIGLEKPTCRPEQVRTRMGKPSLAYVRGFAKGGVWGCGMSGNKVGVARWLQSKCQAGAGDGAKCALCAEPSLASTLPRVLGCVR